MTSSQKMSRYNLAEADLLRENGHAFVDVARLGLKHDGKCCLTSRAIFRLQLTQSSNRQTKKHPGLQQQTRVL